MVTGESTSNAEILWTLKLVKSHMWFKSCADLSKLVLCMFLDSEIATKFTLSKPKCAYLMSFGIAPHFKIILLTSIQNSPFYSLSFHESLNPVMQSCNLDIDICYWNETNNSFESWYIGILIYWIYVGGTTFLRFFLPGDISEISVSSYLFIYFLFI